MTLDPIQLALTQNRLDYITRQMGDVMVRTARSPIFSQAHDFTCFVCGPDGWLVSQADGIPIHSGGGGFAVRAVLRDFEDDIEPGDIPAITRLHGVMFPEEIHPEVVEKLDEICRAFGVEP